MDILTLSSQAKLAKEKDPNVINAIIGMYLDEDGSLGFPTVKEILENQKAESLIPYGQTTGGKPFEERVYHWVFGRRYKEINDHFYSVVAATPGGSGAINIALSTFGNVDTPILVPDIRWRYDYFAQSANKEILEFKMFNNEGKFNLLSLAKQISELKSSDYILVINDPCHNPTGYSLTEDELDKIINIVNSSNKKCLIVYDIAYQDFHPDGMQVARDRLARLTKLSSINRVSVTFSGSKTFGVYGIRLGALINLYSSKEERDNHKPIVVENILGKWSTSPSSGIELIHNILNTENEDEFRKDLDKASKTLKQRGDLFVKEAKVVGLKHYPYKGGFFILLESKNLEEDFKRLQKNKIHTVPISGGLRISLSSVKISEIMGLAAKIHNIVSVKTN